MEQETPIRESPSTAPAQPHLSDEQLLRELQRRITLNHQTVDELTRINNELKVVNKKLEESEALKSHFISNITNEIINPFTSILGLSRAILSVDKESWKKVISMVALIHAEAFTLDFQFRNIFFAARIEAGEEAPSISAVDIRELIEDVLENFRLEIRKQAIQIVLEDSLPKPEASDQPLMFKTDGSYVRLALANLLNNAINFSAKGSEIKISMELQDGRLCLGVHDHGVGIEEALRDSIFDRFQRGCNVINSVNRGHGLGLSVSKAVVDLLEGEIRLKTEQGKGSSFWIYLPEAPAVTEEFITTGSNEIFFEDMESF